MIYLYAPFYIDKSNGIATAYEFVRIMNESGLEAKILCSENERYDFEIPDKIKPYYISKAAVPKEVSDDDVMIYLDTVPKDAPKAKRVVCWLLNKPGALTADTRDFRASDVMAAYSTLVHKKLPQLFMLRDERALFSKLRGTCARRKDTVSIYFGKVHISRIQENDEQLQKILKNYKKVNIITRSSPMNREQALRNIAQSSLLISYDPLSNINYEATLLGTPVLMMDDAYNIKNTKYNVGNYGFAFSEKELTTAKKQVDRAFEEYNRHLKNQDKIVYESFLHILKQVEQIQTDAQALLRNEEFNQTVEEDFKNFYKSIKEPFVNINFPHEIPQKTKEIIGISGNVTTAAHLVSDLGNTLKTSDANRLYSLIKPKWADTMYRKLPGDLKVGELFFLMFRRMMLKTKRIWSRK